METVPTDYENIGAVMSNFDHTIEPETEEKLKSGKFYGEYPAWNFHGDVWFDGERFKCMVMRYWAHIETVEASSLEEIMEIASTKWGSD